MDCSFEERKRELESECKVPANLFESASNRVHAFMQPFIESYRRHDQADRAKIMVQGLCSDLERKNAESIAYLFGLERKEIQNFVGESPWDDKPLRKELSRQIGSQLGEPDGVIVFDPSGFPKSGKQSVGVIRQWCGHLGKIDNCQVAVYMGYVSSQGHALVDTELYLPKEWTKDKRRMKKAGVPKDRQRHRTRHKMSFEFLDRHGKQLPHSWVTGDDEMGRPLHFRRELRDRNERYLLAVPCNTKIRDLEVPLPTSSGAGRPTLRRPWGVDNWVAERSDDEWTAIEVRDGEKGPLSVEVLKRRVETGNRKRLQRAEEILVVIRYRDRDSAIIKTDYYLSNADETVTLAEFCRVAKAEHRIEECLQRGKSQAGMADYEVRNWVGWHHHQTLSLLASWFLNVETRRAEKKDARDNFQSDTNWNCISPTRRTWIRYNTVRHTSHRETITP
jgi:SRSO17 transposase